MKKLFVCILTTILTLVCFTACDMLDNVFGKKSGVDKKYYENCAVLTFDDFESKISITLERSVPGEGTIYYQVNLEKGALSVNYKDTGFIHNMQPLGEFAADDEMPINSSGGYVEGDKISIQFETFSPVSGEIIIAFTEDALNTVRGDLHFLRNQAGCEWLNEITAENISAIKIVDETVGIAPGNLKTISSSTDEAVIARIFDDYYWLDTWPISKMDGQIYGGGAVTVKFILKDGTEKALYINNGNYLDTNGNYFELLYTPNFKASDNATKAYGFITYIDTGAVYEYDYPELGEKIGGIDGISELEFIPYVWTAENLPSHVIETEFGMLKIYDFAVFTYDGDAYLVTNDNFNFYNFFTKP